MDYSPAGEIKDTGTGVVGPAAGVPGPAGYGVVDESGEEEYEEEGGEEAASFGYGADC